MLLRKHKRLPPNSPVNHNHNLDEVQVEEQRLKEVTKQVKSVNLHRQ